MNPSDEEEIKEDDVAREEAEVALPHAVEEERIVRHAEKNDSYREAPTLDNEEEIVQPPLDPSDEVEVKNEVEAKVDLPKEDEIEIKEDVPVVQEVVPESAPVISEEIASLPRMSQHDIEPDGVAHEETIVEQAPAPEVIPQTVKEVVPDQVVEAQQIQPQAVPVQTAEPVVYHTISGGPETLNDIASHHKNVDQVVSQPVTTATSANAATGYAIPNPNYVPPVVQVPAPQSYFGIILFFSFVFIVGGAIAGLYFFIPDTFSQFISAIAVVKDQILKK